MFRPRIVEQKAKKKKKKKKEIEKKKTLLITIHRGNPEHDRETVSPKWKKKETRTFGAIRCEIGDRAGAMAEVQSGIDPL